MNPKLSLTLIVKNEAAHLDTVLKNAHVYADEIVIVDTGSTDNTKVIAAKYTDKIYDFKWIDDFAAARNYGIEKCTGDYFMWLDADDEIKDEDAIKIQNLKNTIENFQIYFLPYFYGKSEDGTPAVKVIRERIFVNNKKFKFSYPIHEVIEYSHSDKVKVIDDICVYHNKKSWDADYSYRNIKICESNLEKDQYKCNSRLWWVYARELKTHQKFAAAVDAYKKAIEYANVSEPYYAYLYYGLGESFMSMTDYEEAMFNFRIASTLLPDWREPLFMLYKTQTIIGDFSNAKSTLLKLMQLPNSSLHEVPDPRIYNNEYIQNLLDNI